MKLYRNFTSQEEIDLEYNIALNVADRERWIEWYARESAKVRDELDCMLDVRFGPTVDETIDIFPARKPGAPGRNAGTGRETPSFCYRRPGPWE